MASPSSATYSVSVTAHHTFSLTLEANPSTGYQWALSNPLDTRFLTMISNEYIAPAPSQRVGQGGHQLVTFQTLEPGMTSISLKYCRPWDARDCGSFAFYVVMIT